MPETDRATDTGNMDKNFGEDCVCGSGDRQTDRETNRRTHSSQYFAIAPVGEVKIRKFGERQQTHHPPSYTGRLCKEILRLNATLVLAAVYTCWCFCTNDNDKRTAAAENIPQITSQT